jgi:Rps23 Pro-64 3,4-dihydroxylase Tpa1-like proline 4-hydroxylase
MDAEHVANRGKAGDATNKEVPKSLGKNTDKTETKELKDATAKDKVITKEVKKEVIKEEDDEAKAETKAEVKKEVKKEEVKKEEIKKDGKAVKKDATDKATEIVRKPNVTQIVKGDKVITVKAGYSYFVRTDSIIEIPPVKSLIKR